MVLLPVPGRSRASALLRPAGRTGRLSCAWYPECTGFAAGSRQIAGKRARTPSGQNQATQLCLTPRMHRFCCRFPADRGQARSYALRAEPGDLIVPGTPSAQVLLPVSGRSRASALLRPPGRNGDSIVLGTPRAQVLLPVSGRSRASALLRPAGRTRRLSCAWYSACTGFAAGSRQIAGKRAPTPSGQNQATQLWLAVRVHRFCCRFPADRGQARSYALWAEAGDSVVPGTPHAQVLLPVSGRSRDKGAPTPSGQNQATQLCLVFRMHRFCCRFPADRPTAAQSKRAPTPCGQNQSLQKKLYMQREEDSCYGLRPESRAELISRTQPKTVGANLFARGRFSRQGSVGRTSLSRMNSLPQG